MNPLKEVLIYRLKDRGMEPGMIPGFIRILTNTFASIPHLSLIQANRQLRYMGWDDFELDYFTFQLIIECLEAYGLKKTEYISAEWFENKFSMH